MKLKYILFLFYFSFSFFSFAQAPQKIWDKTLGGSGDDGYSYSNTKNIGTISTTDGGFVIAGTSNSDLSADKTEISRGGQDFWIVKINANGQKVWDKTIGSSDNDYLYSIVGTTDGGFVLAGSSGANSGPLGDKTTQNMVGWGRDFWIVKINANGQKVWDKNFGGYNDDIPSSIITTSDGGFIIGGYSDSGISGDKTDNNKGSGDYWILKINANGQKIWDKTLGGNGVDKVSSILLTSDGSIVVAGTSNSDISNDKTEPNRGDDDYWIVKLNANGQKIWDKTLGGTSGEYKPSIISTANGDFIIAGISNSPISGDKTVRGYRSDCWIIMLNSVGQLVWDNISDNTNAYERSVTLINTDDGFIIAVDEDWIGSSNIIVKKMNSVGQQVWSQALGSSYNYSPNVIKSNDNGYIISCSSNSNISFDKSEDSRGGLDYWIIKLGNTIPPTSSIKLSQSATFSGGIPELTTGKTYNLEFGLKNTGTTAWQGDINWKLSNGTYRLSNSNISIPVGGSGVFTTSYSPITSEVGNNLPVAIYTKTTGSGVYDLAGVVNGTQNPISINIKLPSTAVEKAIPFIRLDKAEYLPGEVVRVTGGNFVPNEVISLNANIKDISATLPFLNVQTDGSISGSFTIPSTAKETSISVTATDFARFTPAWTALIKQSETSNITIIKPYKANQTIVIDANGFTTIEFSDKILPWFPNTSVSAARRNYQYIIGYKVDGSNTITNVGFSAFKNGILNSKINESVSVQLTTDQFPVGTSKNIRFVVTDGFNDQRVAESPLVTIQTVASTIKVSQKWDKSFDKTIANDPVGIAADGVGRIYLVIEKNTTTGSAISSVSASLASSDGANDAAWLGRIKFASTQNNNIYSEEANGITTTTASSGTALSQYWFWYVAPDDFMRNGMPYAEESERNITVNFTITFADGSATSKTHKITIVRPPVILVHGLGGSASSTWDAFPFRNSPVFKQIEALDMYPNQYFGVNAMVLIGKDASKRSSSFQYQLQKMRENGYACNQVDYVCHSMGGSMFRTMMDNYKPFYYQSGTQINNPNKTYGQGFANKFITLDTPHNGSPWGDLITAIAPRLPFGLRVLLTDIYLLQLKYSTPQAFVKPTTESLNDYFYKFEATGAVENLQVFSSSGGINFKELSGIPSHLIAGDVVQGSGIINANLEDELLKNEDTWFKMKVFSILVDYLAYNKYNAVEDVVKGENLWLIAFKLYVNSKIDLNAIANSDDKAKMVIQLLTEFVKMYYPPSTSDIFYDGDIIVPLSSQTAGFTSGNHVSILNEQLIDISKNHLAITEDVTTANKVKLLLNSAVTSTYFTTTIPENKLINTPSGGGGGGGSFRVASTQTSTNRPFVESFDKTKIEIVSPTTLSNLKVGQNIAAKVNVKDLAYLKRVELVFQSNIYGDTLINSNYNFYPNVETSMLGKQLIVATATYVKNDSVFLKMDTLSVNIMTDETVEIFRVSPKYKNIGLDEKFIPNYNVGYGKFITHYVDKSKLAVNISNSSVINYDNTKGRFVGLQKGESQVVFTYEGKKDTIYIAVADGGAAYTSAITTGTITNTTVCPGGILQVPYTTTGTFGVGNEFLIQISDLTGENFQTLETTAGSNLAAYLPKNIKAGSYKVRVISTNDPIIGTVSSSTIVVQKYSNPPTLVASKTTFVEGERITLTGGGCPASFQFAHTPFYSFTNGTPVTVSPLTDTKIECFCVNSNNTCYSESATPIYLTKEVCSPNKSIIYSSGVINNEGDRVNIEETSDYITSVNKLNTSNTYNEYHSGKYVLLNSGFEVKGGSTFKASINGCNNTNTTNLLGYYPFNFYGIEESGNNKTIFYSQGFYTGGQRLSLVAGKHNQNKAISIDSSPVSAFSYLYQLASTNQSSYSFWVKTNINKDNSNSKYAVISQTISSSIPLSFTVGYETTDGSYYCEVANSSANKVGKKVIMPNNNQWTHIVVTFKYAPAIANFPLTSNDFSIYVNGVKSTGTSNILSVGIGGTEINNYKTGNYQFFNYSPTNTTFLGQFDDFRLYDKALTDAEVLQIYNSEKP